MIARQRVLIFDDNEDHAESVRSLLANVTSDQWIRGAGSDFELDVSEIILAKSSAAHVAAWRNGEPCDYELVVADVHMPGGADEGALAVLKALSKVERPPLLVVMTERIEDVADPMRRDIEALANAPTCPVRCLVTSKHGDMKAVREPERQLEKATWRGYFIRAVASRGNPDALRRLQSEADHHRKFGQLPALQAAFVECGRAREDPLVIVISEPRGLLGSFARAYNNRVDPLPELSPSVFDQILLHLLRDKRAYDAICAEEADDFLQFAFSSDGDVARQKLQMLTNRVILSGPAADETSHPFAGQLFLQVSPEADARFASVPFYRDLPKVRIPSFAKMREEAEAEGRNDDGPARRDLFELVRIMLSVQGVVADPFDVAVMAAYDWGLGFQGRHSGVEALRACATWMKGEADESRAPPGAVIGVLMQEPKGRASIWAGIDRSNLLRLVLELQAQHHRDVCTQAAAFMYFKVLCTTGPEAVRRSECEAFWGKRGLFRKLKDRTAFPGKLVEGAWPSVEDSLLYVWSDTRADKSKSVAARMAERVSASLKKPTASSTNLDTIRALWPRHGGGRKPGIEQLGVLEKRFIARLRGFISPTGGITPL
jgi:CheY-like chemotaxis protein